MGLKRREKANKEKANELMEKGGGAGAGGGDSRLPLKPMQHFKLKQSWKAVKRSLDETAVDTFIRFVKDKPDACSHLSISKGDIGNESALRSNEDFEAQAVLLFTPISDGVEMVEDVDSLLDHICSTHKQFYRAFSRDMINALERPIMDAIENTLGDRFSAAMAVVYRMVVHFFVDELAKLAN